MISALSEVGLGTLAFLAFGALVLGLWIVLHRRRRTGVVSVSAMFYRSDVGKTLTGSGITPGSTVGAFVDHHHVTVVGPVRAFHDWADETDSIQITREQWDGYLSVPRTAS